MLVNKSMLNCFTIECIVVGWLDGPLVLVSAKV